MMPDLIITTTNGEHTSVTESELQKYLDRIMGTVHFPGSGRYEKARRVFNHRIDRQPALIVRCDNANDVGHSVRFARERDLLTAVRGGGYSMAGTSVCDGGLVIDLSAMRDIKVYPGRQTVDAEPGLQVSDFDRTVQQYGLATPMGIISGTGISGLTLGGGLGWLNGKYGLACDNLISADVVTADGNLIKASKIENEGLFWGLRGGGGNFGIVTSFEYQLHPVSQVLGGMILYNIDSAPEVLQFYDEYSRDGPDELSTAAALLASPDGNPVAAVLACHCGQAEQAEKDLEPLQSFGSPLTDHIQPLNYVQIQQLLDGYYPPGRHHYRKCNYIRSLSDKALEVLIEYARIKPSPHTIIMLQQMHGAAACIDPADTAFLHRKDQYELIIQSQWKEEIDSEKNIKWTRDLWKAMQPFVEQGVNLNMLGEEEQGRVPTAFGPNYDRLRRLKKKYDPKNFFRHNHNIEPA